MTEAGWTREKPNKPGFYWYRATPDVFPRIANISRNAAHFTSGTCVGLDDLDGEWLGPLSPTDRQQGRVAAFKEVEQRFDSMFGATDRRIDSVRDYRVDKFYTWLAQAAQDEKGVGDA